MPGWMAALQGSSEFVDASPFGIGSEDKAPPAADQELSDVPPAGAPSEYDRGFAAGELAGRAALQSEFDAHDNHKAALRLAFRTLDSAAMEALANELTETVLALCDAAVAKHAADPEELKPRAEAAARKLGSAAKSCTLLLHPDDIELLEEGALSDWTIEPDDTLERGSIALIGDEGGVRDGPAEWRRAIAAALRG